MPHEQTIPTDTKVAGQHKITHWEGCYRDPAHHACALAEIERLKAQQRWTVAQWYAQWEGVEKPDIAPPLENEENPC